MTAPAKLGCRVLDKDGDDETPRFWEEGLPEWRALRLAQQLALMLPDYAPFRVVDADGVTLHTIHASEASA